MVVNIEDSEMLIGEVFLISLYIVFSLMQLLQHAISTFNANVVLVLGQVCSLVFFFFSFLSFFPIHCKPL